MKRIYTDLYPQIIHPLNLWAAYKKAARGKRYQPAAAGFEYDLEANLIELEQELKGGTYQPGAYTNFYIQSPKRRLISAAPFRDRVVQHALMNVIEPLFERQFIFDSYANRKAKGTHLALDRCTAFMRRYRFVMHCDVLQFFPSIDHQILCSILDQTVGDPQVRGLMRKIIFSGADIQTLEYDLQYFPEDALFSPLRPRGLPIGNLTSQHWANVCLNELDQFAKRSLKIKAYIRYVDDILLFANQKQDLLNWRKEIIKFLQSLRLKLHENQAQPRPVGTGIPFLGFIVFPTHRRLKHANGFAFQRRYRDLQMRVKSGKIPQKEFTARILSWINHASHGDTWGLRKAILNSQPDQRYE
jgi:RNA-directed DNA polymerase